MIVWWTREWDILVGRGSLKTTNSVHATVTMLYYVGFVGGTWNGREGLVSEKPPFSWSCIITHGEGDQTEWERSFKQRILQITVNGGEMSKKKKKETMIYRTETSARCC